MGMHNPGTQADHTDPARNGNRVLGFFLQPNRFY
ncbi:MAG: hypothetical protein RLZZ123_1305 [Pseudomonadota bacterium]|jgi:hypothetical protein